MNVQNSPSLLGDLGLLPPDILVKIVHQLPLSTLMRIREVCKTSECFVEKNLGAFDTQERRQLMAGKIHTYTIRETEACQINMVKEKIYPQLSDVRRNNLATQCVEQMNTQNTPRIIEAYTKTFTFQELFFLNKINALGLKAKMNQVLSLSMELGHQALPKIPIDFGGTRLPQFVQGAIQTHMNNLKVCIKSQMLIGDHLVALDGEDQSQELARKIHAISIQDARKPMVDMILNELKIALANQNDPLGLIKKKMPQLANDIFDQIDNEITPQILACYTNTFTLEELKLINEKWNSDLKIKLDEVALLSMNLGEQNCESILSELIESNRNGVVRTKIPRS